MSIANVFSVVHREQRRLNKYETVVDTKKTHLCFEMYSLRRFALVRILQGRVFSL